MTHIRQLLDVGGGIIADTVRGDAGTDDCWSDGVDLVFTCEL